ncbi:MAG TPA: DUF4177 domain-containing protein [Desulfobacteria bacterium]|nr:DUF4177 domain-containing protein [Desulfobacteria bacterium]
MGKQFVYEIKKYSAEQFVRLAYFCTDEGDCRLDELPSEHLAAFADLLNERGADGWELVQAFFNTDGVVTVWKREK